MGQFFINQLKLRDAFILVVCAILLSVSCSSQREGSVSQNTAAETREVTDEAGRRVSVPLRVERIVTLAPNLTEIVYVVGAGNRLVGNTTYCNYPAEAMRVTKIGDTMQPNIERIVALRPQLVLVSTASQLEAFTRQLNEQGIAVYVTDPRSLEDVFRSIKSLGELLNEAERAEQVVNDLRARASAVEAAVKTSSPVKVFYQVSAAPLYTIGREAFLTDLIRRAGGQSVTADVPGAFPRYSDEAALATQPEAIILSVDSSMDEGNAKPAPSLAKSPAVTSGRVYGINGDLLSRPGPRLVEGLEQMARVLHPEDFKQ
ncbi:MAG TPA: cobalamin-binding protein [Pyrinomonadaceae bacterium]|nr:cobalamin-binding protein [Pyrinomonadaceae bacterium]